MYHIDLVESDYFGMQFMDTEHVSVRKQAASKLLRPMDHVTSYCLHCFHKKKNLSLLQHWLDMAKLIKKQIPGKLDPPVV